MVLIFLGRIFMKKFFLIYALIVMIVLVNIYMSNRIIELNNMLISLQNSTNNELNFAERLSKLESNIDEYTFQIIDRNISQLQNHSKLELNRMEDLIEKVGDVKTIYGEITGLDEISGEKNIDITPVDSNEKVQLHINKNCSVYVISEIGLVLIDFSEFEKIIIEDLNKGNKSGYTFKIIDGQIAHIYQGWGGLE